MSFEALQERLTALQGTTAQLKELIDRLSNLKFQPGSVPLDQDDEDNVAGELGTEIHQILREEEEDLELLQEEITDLRSAGPRSEAEHNKARLKDGAVRLGQELRSCRVSFRKAQLAARRSLEQARRLERELLLASYVASAAATPTDSRSGASSPTRGAQQPPDDQQQQQQHHHGHRQQLFPASYRRRRQQQQQQDKGPGGDVAVVATAADVTAALRRTHAQIAAELSRSAFARQTLAESTQALAALREGYAGLEGLLSASRELAGALLTSAKSDTWYLETTLAVLLATLAWLVFRRWLYGPLWWVLWLPARTLWRTGSAVGGLGRGGGAGELGMAGGRTEARGEGVVGGSEVPTAMVGGLEEGEAAPPDPDSMVEKVGRIVGGRVVEGQVDVGERAENASENEANPKKRMWEEDVEAATVGAEGGAEGGPERERDEL